MAVKPNFKHNLGKLSGPSHFDESYQADEEGIVNACITRASNALCAQMTIQQLYALPGLQFNRDSQITLEWPLSEYRAPDAWKDWKQVCGNFKVAAEQLARAYRFGDIRGEELQAVGRSHVHTASGTLVHLWESPAAARRFARGWKHIWRALFEHSIRGIHAPLSVLIEIEGRFVSLTALLPVGAGPTTSLPNGAGPQDTMLGTQAQHLVNGLFLPAGTSVELHLGHDGRHYLLSTREATVQRLQTHSEDVMVRFEARERHGMHPKNLGPLIDVVRTVFVPAAARELVNIIMDASLQGQVQEVIQASLVRDILHSNGVNMVLMPAVYDAVEKSKTERDITETVLQVLRVEMIGRIFKNFIRIDIARNDKSQNSRFDVVNRVVRLFVKKDPDFWNQVVAQKFEEKYRVPLFFSVNDVNPHGVLKVISMSTGCKFVPDQGRFCEFLNGTSIVIVGHDEPKSNEEYVESWWRAAEKLPACSTKQFAAFSRAATLSALCGEAMHAEVLKCVDTVTVAAEFPGKLLELCCLASIQVEQQIDFKKEMVIKFLYDAMARVLQETDDADDAERDSPMLIQMIAHRTEDPEAGIPIPTSLAALGRMAGRAGIVPTANENFVALSKAVLKLAVVAPNFTAQYKTITAFNDITSAMQMELSEDAPRGMSSWFVRYSHEIDDLMETVENVERHRIFYEEYDKRVLKEQRTWDRRETVARGLIFAEWLGDFFTFQREQRDEMSVIYRKVILLEEDKEWWQLLASEWGNNDVAAIQTLESEETEERTKIEYSEYDRTRDIHRQFVDEEMEAAKLTTSLLEDDRRLGSALQEINEREYIVRKHLRRGLYGEYYRLYMAELGDRDLIIRKNEHHDVHSDWWRESVDQLKQQVENTQHWDLRRRETMGREVLTNRAWEEWLFVYVQELEDTEFWARQGIMFDAGLIWEKMETVAIDDKFSIRRLETGFASDNRREETEKEEAEIRYWMWMDRWRGAEMVDRRDLTDMEELERRLWGEAELTQRLLTEKKEARRESNLAAVRAKEKRHSTYAEYAAKQSVRDAEEEEKKAAQAQLQPALPAPKSSVEEKPLAPVEDRPKPTSEEGEEADHRKRGEGSPARRGKENAVAAARARMQQNNDDFFSFASSSFTPQRRNSLQQQQQHDTPPANAVPPALRDELPMAQPFKTLPHDERVTTQSSDTVQHVGSGSQPSPSLSSPTRAPLTTPASPNKLNGSYGRVEVSVDVSLSTSTLTTPNNNNSTEARTQQQQHQWATQRQPAPRPDDMTPEAPHRHSVPTVMPGRSPLPEVQAPRRLSNDLQPSASAPSITPSQQQSSQQQPAKGPWDRVAGARPASSSSRRKLRAVMTSSRPSHQPKRGSTDSPTDPSSPSSRRLPPLPPPELGGGAQQSSSPTRQRLRDASSDKHGGSESTMSRFTRPNSRQML